MIESGAMLAKGRARTRAIWEAASSMAARGERITYRKLAAAVGLRSHCDIKVYLDRLEAMGYINQGPRGTYGTLRVLIPLIAA